MEQDLLSREKALNAKRGKRSELQGALDRSKADRRQIEAQLESRKEIEASERGLRNLERDVESGPLHGTNDSTLSFLS